MIYVALLRGINVGGNRKVDMAELKAVFEDSGMTQVATYINSGNVIFVSKNTSSSILANTLGEAIETKFGFPVDTLVKSREEIRVILKALPQSLTNDATMKADVMFLWPSVDDKSVLDQLKIKPDLDQVIYVKGAVIWSAKRDDVGKSGMLKIIGTPLYAQMTIRNCNTARKLFEKMNELTE